MDETRNPSPPRSRRPERRDVPTARRAVVLYLLAGSFAIWEPAALAQANRVFVSARSGNDQIGRAHV